MEAKYCKCLNTYTINKCKKKRCNAPDYWKQGIGSTISSHRFILKEDGGLILQENNGKIII